MRMYDNQKIKFKSSSSILPDESSTNEHLKRRDLQAWLTLYRHGCVPISQAKHRVPSYLWQRMRKTEEGIRPIWFTCPQLLPSLSKKSSKGQKKCSQTEIGFLILGIDTKIIIISEIEQELWWSLKCKGRTSSHFGFGDQWSAFGYLSWLNHLS